MIGSLPSRAGRPRASKKMSRRARLERGTRPGGTFIWRCWPAALRDEGYGGALGRFIQEDGVTLPTAAELEALLRNEPAHPLAPARADFLQAIRQHGIAAGRIEVKHPWKHTSIFGAGVSARRPAHRPSRHWLRHHFESSVV